MDTDSPAPEDIVAELALAVGQLVRRVRSEGNPGGLGLSQTSAIARLATGGAMTTAELARIEAMKPQSMGTVLAGLESAGLVRRRPDPRDGRQILFELTEAGAAARHDHQSAKRARLLEAVLHLTEGERRTLAAAIPLIRRLGEP
jgi:DNA-binding MarR family transcriptional regulator